MSKYEQQLQQLYVEVRKLQDMQLELNQIANKLNISTTLILACINKFQGGDSSETLA